ncbi:MAG: hypothetical protein QNM02_09970 [Acidimicrobiia bacterium]|nr:hypothetical protein [Acidimicrobiia bacterium]
MSNPFTTAWHLSARFFTSLSPRPAPAADETWVAATLTSDEYGLWVQMSNQDRRHSALVARRFAARRPDATRAEVAGAMLHDVGKIECGLGTFGRVAGTIIGPRGRRFTAYHQHEAIGAQLAAEAGSDPSTVALIAGEGPAFADLDAVDHA